MLNVNLTPETQKFIEAQVKAGQFDSPEAVLIEALNRMMAQHAPNPVEPQHACGEVVDFEQFAVAWQKNFSSR